jgi:D-alanine--poly(phosphoribitol) ligase subunit 2
LVDQNGIIQRLDAMFFEALQMKVPSPDTDFIETGMVDSLQLVELLLQLEKRFACRIDIDDIELDDFRTLNSIARLVARTEHGETNFASATSPPPPGGMR